MNNLQSFISDTWEFYTANIVSLAMIVLLPILAIDFVAILDMTVVLVDFDTTLHLFVLHCFAIPLYLSAVIIFIAYRLRDESPSIKVVYAIAFRYWAPVAVLFLVTSLLIGLGLLLFILPGLIVMSRTIYAQFYCVIDNAQPIEAIKKSWHETEESQWVILLGLLLMYTCAEVPRWLAAKSLSTAGVPDAVIYAVSSTLYSILFSLPVIFAFRMYYNRTNVIKS